eukprot:m.14302 g.14302  ORF g.14302 m.14302 type:complete len:140 (+) comp4768_c0_seq2:235-654(+)
MFAAVARVGAGATHAVECAARAVASSQRTLFRPAVPSTQCQQQSRSTTTTSHPHQHRHQHQQRSQMHGAASYPHTVQLLLPIEARPARPGLLPWLCMMSISVASTYVGAEAAERSFAFLADNDIWQPPEDDDDDYEEFM